MRNRLGASFTAANSPDATFGRITLNVLPRPTALSTSIRPPCRVTMPCTTESPSPVPLPASLVVKNGSKMRSRIASGMPSPVSSTVSHTCSPSSAPVRMVSVPPSGIASEALTARFISTCWSWPRSALTGRASGASSISSAMFARTSRRSILAASLTASLRSRGSGLVVSRREKSRSCRVSERPVVELLPELEAERLHPLRIVGRASAGAGSG